MDMLGTRPISLTNNEQLALAKVIRTPDGCWHWPTPINDHGAVTVNQQRIRIHRLIWRAYINDGNTPSTITCGNKHCLNPWHRKHQTHNYRPHTRECAGPDHVLIERILCDGIQSIPYGHVICDCERAWIALYGPTPRETLRINPKHLDRLRHIGQQLWA